jgi:hypothetical protein
MASSREGVLGGAAALSEARLWREKRVAVVEREGERG